MRIRYLLIYFLFISHSFGEVATREEIKEIFYKAINSKEIDDEKRFYLLVLAARNVRKRMPEAPEIEELYLKAFKINIKPEYKIRAYFELFQHFYISKNNHKIKNHIKSVDAEIAKIKDEKFKKGISLSRDYYVVVSTNDTVQESLGKPITHFFGSVYDFDLVYRELDILITKKKFQEAFKLLNLKGVHSNDYSDIILTLDLLGYLNNKQTTNCDKFAKKFKGDPLSNACLSLKQYKVNKKVVYLKRIQEIFGNSEQYKLMNIVVSEIISQKSASKSDKLE